MKLGRQYVDGGDLRIGNLESFGIFPFVEFSTHSQAGIGGGGGNEPNDGMEIAQGLTSPVDAEEGKKSMLSRSGIAPPRAPRTVLLPMFGC
jgi:hypothetical protein